MSSSIRPYTAGYPPSDVTSWHVGVSPSKVHDATCRVWAQPSRDTQGSSYRYRHDGDCTFDKGVPVRFSDRSPSDKDGDAMMELDLRAKTATLRDTSAGGSPRWTVTLRFE